MAPGADTLAYSSVQCIYEYLMVIASGLEANGVSLHDRCMMNGRVNGLVVGLHGT